MVSIEPAPANYSVHGFVVFPWLLDPASVSTAAKEAEKLFLHFPRHDAARKVCYTSGAAGDGMIRIDHPHLVSATIRAFISNSAIGQKAAELTKAQAVQVWYCHMLRKPQGGTDSGNVGWHQDGQYAEFFEGRFITAWIPLTSVTPETSPLCYIADSHQFGIIGGSGFSHTMSLPELKQNILRRRSINWVEKLVMAEPGAVSFHDSMILHGSGNNRSESPRMSITVHLRTERNRFRDGRSRYQMTRCVLKDPVMCPVIYGDSSALDLG